MTELTDKRALIVGVANEQSVAWGVAEALYRAGAMLAITYLDEGAEPRVRPLAERVDACIVMPLDGTQGEDEDLLFERIRGRLGRPRYSRPFDRPCAGLCLTGEASQRKPFCIAASHGYAFSRPPRAAGGASYDKRRCLSCDEFFPR